MWLSPNMTIDRLFSWFRLSFWKNRPWSNEYNVHVLIPLVQFWIWVICEIFTLKIYVCFGLNRILKHIYTGLNTYSISTFKIKTDFHKIKIIWNLHSFNKQLKKQLTNEYTHKICFFHFSTHCEIQKLHINFNRSSEFYFKQIEIDIYITAMQFTYFFRVVPLNSQNQKKLHFSVRYEWFTTINLIKKTFRFYSCFIFFSFFFSLFILSIYLLAINYL